MDLELNKQQVVYLWLCDDHYFTEIELVSFVFFIANY